MTSTIKLTAVLVLSAALGAIGCQQPAQNAPGADTPRAEIQARANPDVYAFKVGVLDVVALRDGTIVLAKAEDFPWDPAAASAALTAAGQPSDTVSLSVQPLLVRDGDRMVLIDTGAGGQMDTEGKLVASLRAAGVTPEQVTDVLISHAHGDHVGGLVNVQGQLTFSNATVRMTAEEWKFAKAGAEAAGAGVLVAAITPRVETFDPGAQVSSSITAVPLRGHTPGHTGYEIASGNDRLLYIGDALHSSVISVSHPELVNRWDAMGDSTAAVATRRMLLERGAGVSIRIYGVHFPFPGLGRFERRGETFVWAPEARGLP